MWCFIPFEDEDNVILYDVKYGIDEKLDNTTGDFFQLNRFISTNTHRILVEKPLYKQVIYVSIRAVRVTGKTVDDYQVSEWSGTTSKWKIANAGLTGSGKNNDLISPTIAYGRRVATPKNKPSLAPRINSPIGPSFSNKGS